MEKIEAELKEAETKQRSLSKAYECVHAQATALLIFVVQWKDLEEHFESTRYSLELQRRELARRETAVRVRYGELEAKEMKFNSEIESKADELGGLQRLIDEKVEEVVQSKNHLHSLQSLIQEHSNEVMVQEKRLMEVEGFVVEKKRECDSIERRVERRQKELKWVERRVEEKLKLAEEKSKLAEVKAEEVRGFEEALEKCVEEIELKKRELNEIIGSIEKRKEEFNSIGEQIMGAEKLMKVQEEQLGFKEERNKEAQRAAEQCDKELKLKKEELVVIDKSLAECSNALESREKKIREIDSKKDKDLCLREKSLEEWSCKLEFKEREVRLGERIVESKAGELRKSKEEGERCLESLSQVLKQKENRLQDLDEELELKQKELDLIKKSTEERAKNLELKERQLEDQAKELELKQKGFDLIKKFSEECTQNLKSKENTSSLLSQVKIEQLEHIPANNVVVPSTSSNQSSVNMDGRGLLLFINEHFKRFVLLGSEISAVLQASPDPAKLVLDAMQGFYHANSSVDKSQCDFDLRITRMTCSLLLENLKSVSPLINPEVREEAIKLAGDWKVKMGTENCLEVLGFLRLVSTYGITSFYDAKELQSLCAIVAKDEQTTELSWAFGMTGKAPDKIEAPASSLANNAGTCSSPNLRLTATTDATHLQGILNELFSRDRLIQTETWAAFQSSSEPEKFVMDVMQTSFDKYCTIEDAGFKEIVMANYISLLDMLMRIKPHVNKDALKLAVNWKSKIGASTQPLELLGFLQFIATYGLLSMFNRETLVFLGRISQQKQALEICQTPGLADKIPVGKVSKKGETSTTKGKTPMLVPVDDILFHKGACQHRVKPVPKPKSQEEVLKIAPSRKAEAEAIRCAAAIVAGKERRLLPPPQELREQAGEEGDFNSSRKRKYKEETGSIPWNDLKVAMQPNSFRYVNNCLVGRGATFDEFDEPLAKNESDRDRMMRLSAYVMTKYDDRLRKVERYKVKFQENKQLVDDARKKSKALTKAVQLNDQTLERLKRRNSENLRLKKQLEATILEASKVRSELDSALAEFFELKKSLPTEREAAVQEFLGSQAFHRVIRLHCTRKIRLEKRKWMAILERYDGRGIIDQYREEIEEHQRKGETFVFELDPSNDEESEDGTSDDEQTQPGEDGSGDAEDGDDGDRGETQHDFIESSTSDEDDS